MAPALRLIRIPGLSLRIVRPSPLPRRPSPSLRFARPLGPGTRTRPSAGCAPSSGTFSPLSAPVPFPTSRPTTSFVCSPLSSISLVSAKLSAAGFMPCSAGRLRAVTAVTIRPTLPCFRTLPCSSTPPSIIGRSPMRRLPQRSMRSALAMSGRAAAWRSSFWCSPRCEAARRAVPCGPRSISTAPRGPCLPDV